MDRAKVVVIGAGNVATHLARAIDRSHKVVQVYSRTKSHASDLASELSSCTATDDPEDIYLSADYYIISVSDDALESVASHLTKAQGIVVHTSGSVGIDALKNLSCRKGVMYPLQTFTKHAEVDMSRVPFFIEADSEATFRDIEALASSLSRHIYKADSKQRKTLHIAAVYACNFFNLLLDVSEDLLRNEGYTLEVLHPLIEATIAKAMLTHPYQAQTGPAVRGDKKIMQKHLSALQGDEREIYRLLSQSILNRHKIDITI